MLVHVHQFRLQLYTFYSDPPASWHVLLKTPNSPTPMGRGLFIKIFNGIISNYCWILSSVAWMASARVSVHDRIDHVSFTFRSKEVVCPSGKWLSSSANSFACVHNLYCMHSFARVSCAMYSLWKDSSK